MQPLILSSVYTSLCPLSAKKNHIDRNFNHTLLIMEKSALLFDQKSITY